ncbi:MAG: Hpt domain-containing protein [Candidatus Eremiobacteraeota bacterium]|nr:Hpt domain-containing protein [Candidatus Eremiobacteraeota bacterium]MBC5827597.1 Hpt domain-containing protein [Candidatus Eremiobacteraeota bacterium]
MAGYESASPNVFDPSRLMEIFACDAAAVREVLDEAITSMRDLVDEMKSASNEGKLETWTSTVHELKGLSATVGAGEMYELIQQLEGGLRDRPAIIESPCVENLAHAYDRFAAAARRYLSTA